MELQHPRKGTGAESRKTNEKQGTRRPAQAGGQILLSTWPALKEAFGKPDGSEPLEERSGAPALGVCMCGSEWWCLGGWDWGWGFETKLALEGS